MSGVTQRLQAAETGLLELRYEATGLHDHVVQLTHRLDRVGRRLDLVDT